MSKFALLLSLINAEIGADLLDVLVAREDTLNPVFDLSFSSRCVTSQDEGVESSFVWVDVPFKELLE